MKNIKVFVLFFLLLTMSYSCQKDEKIDQEKPVIDLGIQDAFPNNCDTLFFGVAFDLKVLFSDNAELGSYSISIHNNFDHHAHSTEITQCNLDPIKEPVNPYTFIEDYVIPDGLKEYEPNISITIPSGNSNGIFDDGDYHFFISLTDKEGWSAQKGLNIKLLHP